MEDLRQWVALKWSEWRSRGCLWWGERGYNRFDGVTRVCLPGSAAWTWQYQRELTSMGEHLEVSLQRPAEFMGLPDLASVAP